MTTAYDPGMEPSWRWTLMPPPPDGFATVGPELAAELARQPGMIFADLGGGVVGIRTEAAQRIPEHEDGTVTRDADGLTLWVGGDSYPVRSHPES